MFDDERLPGIFAAAHVTVSAYVTSARVAALPLEGRACLAEWDDRDDPIVEIAAPAGFSARDFLDTGRR